MWERRHNVIVCFYIVSLPGHSINKCISFSDYRWQYLYCLMMLLLTWELLAGGIWKWEHNLEIRIKKLDLEQNIFLQTKKHHLIIKTPTVIFLTVGSLRNHLFSKFFKVPLIQGLLKFERVLIFRRLDLEKKPPQHTNTENVLWELPYPFFLGVWGLLNNSSSAILTGLQLLPLTLRRK